MGGVLLVVLAAVSIDPVPARSQGSGSGSEAPVDPGIELEDEAPAQGAGDTAADAGMPALVAPALPAAKKTWLTDQLTSAVRARPALAGAKIAVAVTDLASGDELFSLAADAKLNLASNTKLLTATAALGTLGNGFRWRTAVFIDKPADAAGTVAGDLYLRGRGDPTLSAANLESLAAEIAARGVRRIEGRLVLDTAYFDAMIEPPHYDEQPKERAAFRAPVASLGVNRSAATITVVAEPGGAASITLEPDAGDYLRLTKQRVVSVSQGRTRLRIEQRVLRDHVEFEVVGQIRAGEGSWSFRRRIDDPPRLAAEVFRRALADRGVTITRWTIAVGPVPVTARLLAAHDSPPLPEVVRLMNKYSDNYAAESVLKTLGAETKAIAGGASWADGIAAVQAYLATVGLPPGSYRAANGSGLFGSTEVSASQLVTLLAAAHADYRIGPDLVASLPIGGADGTLARRWRGLPARGRVRAKTGTLDKVITLAGYVGVDSGHPLAFAMLVNDVPPGQRGAARAMIDDMVSVLAAYLGAS